MDQVSRPLLIALVAVVGFAGAWFTVLRPGSGGEGPAPAAPGAQGLGRAVDGAKTAADASQRSARAAEQASGSATPAAPRPQPAPAPASSRPAAAPKPRPVAAPVVVTVVLVAGQGADDAAARQVVRAIGRPGVRVVIISPAQIPRQRELAGVTIDTTPTILVIGRDGVAERLTGLPDPLALERSLRAVAAHG